MKITGVANLEKTKSVIIKNYFNTDNIIFDFKNRIKLDEKTESVFFIDINGILSHPMKGII